MLTARLLGGLVVEIDGRRSPDVPGLKPRALLAYLLLNPGPHPRSRLAGRFWPDVLDTSARASLRSALWTIRGALDQVGGGPYLCGDRAAAGLSAELPRALDVEEFGRLLAAGDPASLERALAFGDVTLLPDLVDEWVLNAQDAHRDRLVGAMERLAQAAEAAGDAAGAVAWTRRALERDRLREANHRALMRRLAAAGERGKALEAYRRCRDLLGVELGVAPSAETRSTMEAIRAGTDGAVGGAGDLTAPAPAPAPTGVDALVGRDDELAALGRHWADARAGRGGVVVVSGPAGIGKTHLAGELARRARQEGARTAQGLALDLDAAPPFGPWLDALRELVQGAPAPPAEASWPAELARLCPAVEAAWGRYPTPGAASAVPEMERARLFAAVAEGVAWLARRAPVLIVLEDLHRADPASLSLLASLGATLASRRVLVVVTARPVDERPELDRALDALRRRRALRGELTLSGLADAAVAALVRAAAPDLPAHAADRVVFAAEGNPLLAREAARAAARGLDPAEGLRPAARAALAGLGPPGRELVELLAAAGRPLSPGEAASLMPPDRLVAALRAARAVGLVDPDEERLRFSHDLLRGASYAECPPERRRRHHARLAHALAARSDRSSAQVGRHLVLAGEGSRGHAYLAAAAGEARAVGALDEAAGFLREAAGLADDPAAAAESWLELADVEAWRGDRAGMEDAFARGRDLLRDAGDALGLAGAHAARGRWLRTRVCYPRESLAAYREALDLLELARLDAPEVRVLALAGAAWAEAVAGEPERAERLIAEVQAWPEAARDPVLRAELAADLLMASIRAGRYAEAEAFGRRAGELAHAAGRPDLAFTAYGNAASAAACRGDFATVLELVERCPGRDGGPTLEGHLHAASAYALSRLGRHPEAIAAARAGLALAVAAGDEDLEAVARFDLGAVLLEAGRPEEAAPSLAAALAEGSRRFSRPLARLLLSEAALGAGDLERARAEVGRFPFEPVSAGDVPGALLGRLERVQALIARAAGDPAQALRRLDAAEAEWRSCLAGVDVGDAYAASLADLGRPPVAGLVEPGRELGRALADRALALVELGRDEEAREAAREAVEWADRVGDDASRARLAPLLPAPAGIG